MSSNSPENSMDSSSNYNNGLNENTTNRQSTIEKLNDNKANFETNILEQINRHCLSRTETFDYGEFIPRTFPNNRSPSPLEKEKNEESSENLYTRLIAQFNGYDSLTRENNTTTSTKNFPESIENKNISSIPKFRKSLAITEISYTFEMTPDGPVSFKKPVNSVEKVVCLDSIMQSNNNFSQFKENSLSFLPSITADRLSYFTDDTIKIPSIPGGYVSEPEGNVSPDYDDESIPTNSYDRLQRLLKNALEKSPTIRRSERLTVKKRAKQVIDVKKVRDVSPSTKLSFFKINEILKELDVVNNDTKGKIISRTQISNFHENIPPPTLFKDANEFLKYTSISSLVNKNSSTISNDYKRELPHFPFLMKRYNKPYIGTLDINDFEKLSDNNPLAKNDSQPIKRHAKEMDDKSDDDENDINYKRKKDS